MKDSKDSTETNINQEGSGNTIDNSQGKNSTTVNNRKIELSIGGLLAIAIACFAVGGGTGIFAKEAFISITKSDHVADSGNSGDDLEDENNSLDPQNYRNNLITLSEENRGLKKQISNAKTEIESLKKQLEKERENNQNSVGGPSTLSDSNGCIVLISNPLVDLKRGPSVGSPDIIRVPAGEYNVIEYNDDSATWFKINVGDRVGWIDNSNWVISDKSSACP